MHLTIILSLLEIPIWFFACYLWYKVGQLRAETRILKAYSFILDELHEKLTPQLTPLEVAKAHLEAFKEMADAAMFSEKAKWFGKQMDLKRKEQESGQPTTTGTPADFNQT